MDFSKAPLITVYITNYNYGLFIQQSVESLLNQTFQDFEVIIIDDGSTDNSKEIIENYSQNPKVSIIHQQNKGLNKTNNIALRAARGKYIMRLDADDYLETNALEVMSAALENDSSLGLVFPDYYIVDKEGNELYIEQRHSFDKDVRLFDQPAHGACTMIRTEFLREVGGYDEQYRCQDGYELWIKFVTRYKVTNINNPLFYYRQHGSNLTSNEERILNTRKQIKENFLASRNEAFPKVLTIIPVRNKNTIAFQKISDTYLLDITLEKVFQTQNTGLVVVSSPDELVEEYCVTKYASEKRFIFHKRNASLSTLDSTLDSTVESILEIDTIIYYKPEFILLVSPEFPLIQHKTFEDAINTIKIFNSDSLISVRIENSIFYKHDGEGMKPILNQDKFTKLEREALYRNVGGITACTIENFETHKKIISGKVSHIVVSQKEALKADSDFNVKLIEFVLQAL